VSSFAPVTNHKIVSGGNGHHGLGVVHHVVVAGKCVHINQHKQLMVVDLVLDDLKNGVNVIQMFA